MTNESMDIFTEEDLLKMFENQTNDYENKEKERLVLNEFCKDSSIPSNVKAEAQIYFAIKWGIK